MGDTNSRLNFDDHDEAVRISNSASFHSLFKHDQLRALRTDKKMFYGFEEMEPMFKPTFKYDVGTNTYDTSEKQRIPAWCDRILYWRKDANVIVHKETYTSKQDITWSDHKPVQSLIKLDLNLDNAGIGGVLHRGTA